MITISSINHNTTKDLINIIIFSVLITRTRHYIVYYIYWWYGTHTRGSFRHMSLSKTCRTVSGWILGGKREPSLPPDIRLHESVVQCGRCVRPLNLSRAAKSRMSVAPVNTVILSREVPFFCFQSEIRDGSQTGKSSKT